ncbi:hypothetical protein [Nakamurella aerolata]|uniref:Abi-like protein n=1 Tax=Nakamurella aerolata TaxID=1656892 RepID=A0A849A2Y7_9ACTN|nr:hypothetical protein [Nakamurella aerolata]NNG34925.1 hypothetical protein [Nakamurella aerolata]
MLDPSVDYTLLQDLITTERLSSYFKWAGGDLDRAFELYEWNMEASAAALSVAAMVEVIVRNALDRELTAWAAKRQLGDWLAAVPLDPRGREDIVKARARAARGGRQVKHGHVVAELSLGFWRFLLASKYLTSLWIPALGRAFPFAAGDERTKRRQMESHAQQILYLRNRAAHHEPIHRRDLAADMRRALRLVGAVDATAESWVRSRERLTTVIAERPMSPGP